MSILSVRSHFQALRELVGLLTRHRQLTWEMSKAEIREQYSGQVFGALWVIGHPLVLIAIYVFIFGFVFKAKIGGTVEMPLDYTTYILAGLIPWMTCPIAMGKGAIAISANASLVKQVVFPIEILPVKSVLTSFLSQIVATVVLIVWVLAQHGHLPWTYLLVPALFVLQVLGLVGLSYVLAAFGAYFRDTKDFVQVFSTAGLYLMPVIYLPEWVPALFRPLLYLNPFSYMGWCYQDACYYGRFEHPWAWPVFVLLSLGSFYAGYRVFRKVKTMFGNVL